MKKLKIKTKKRLAKIEDIELVSHATNCMYIYGMSLIEDRALADFRDGLKPSQRRILYAAHRLGMTPGSQPKKSARLTGDCIARLHPHGDLALYGVAVNCANSPEKTIEGFGNWGSLNDGPAAARYTNARLSRYGGYNFFDPEYMRENVTQMHPNYDGSTEEPMILPSLLPNLLLNGAFGIGVGITTDIPAFTLESVVKLLPIALTKKLTAQECYDTLKFNTATFNGENSTVWTGDKESRKEILRFMATGTGSAIFCAPYTFDAKTRTITVTGMPPNGNVEKIIESLNEDERVERALDATSKSSPLFHMRIVLRKSIAASKLMNTADSVVEDYLVTSKNYKFNVIERTYDPVKELPDAKLKHMNVPQFFEEWCAWRIDLEKKMLAQRMLRIKEAISELKLMILAARNIDVIVKALKRTDTEAYMMKMLKLKAEQVEFILGKQIRTLKALEEKAMTKKLKERQNELAQNEAWYRAPAKKIKADLPALIERIRKVTKETEIETETETQGEDE